jgi:Rap guanine nucleotide exchange factor 2
MIKDRVTRVVLLWVNNHFIDFETDTELMAFLQKFQMLLENSKDMSGQLRLLQIACSAKSRPRTLALTRPSRDDPLPFNIMGGADNGYGIYISQVDSGSKAEELGVRRGDELVEVNGQSFRNINLSKAFDILRGSTHLVLTVKCNFLGYHECVHSSIPLVPRPSAVGNNTTHVANLKQHKNLSRKERLIKTLMRIHFLPKTSITDKASTDETDILIDGSDPCKIDFPENVLKIFRADQTFKYFLVNKETTAREVVMLALQEFVDLQNHNSRDYALFQVSVTSGILKQGRLPDQLDSLAERIPLGARYYIKRSDSTEPLVPDDLLSEIMRECEVGFLHLNPVELALQLTLEDYAIFRQIEMTEFIDDLFQLNSKYGIPNLNAFAQLVNRETFWVVTEVTKELVLPRRVQILKRFIKVATQCRECRNFNSMFAIVSGLGHCSVARLRNTWDKLPTKHQRLFNEMQELMDPSRNMGKYRSLLAQTAGQTPMIPFYPVVRKDLTFIDLGNLSTMENLINFEKMRMVAKEIRQLVQMSAAPFDTSSQPTMAAMNQLNNTGTQLTTTTGKRRKKSQGPPNAKKMFEEMNMIRKVKAYLSKLQVISDENVLHSMSLNCEPAGEVVKKCNPPQPRRHPSPTLSTSSSASSESNRRKFGAGSPGSYQKLMALSEPKTKIHQHNFRSSPTMQRKHSHHERSNSESSSTSSRLLLSVESSSVLPGK